MLGMVPYHYRKAAAFIFKTMSEDPTKEDTSPDQGVSPESPSVTSSDDAAGDELGSPPAEGTDETDQSPSSPSEDVTSNDDESSAQNELQQLRSANHSKLRAYEAKRRSAYAAKLQSSSLYWRAFRTLMNDSVLETQKAEILMKGWTHASEAYCTSMKSVGEWCIDEKGVPVTDAKKKKKMLEAQEKEKIGAGATAGAASDGIGGASIFHAQQRSVGERRDSLATAEFSMSEKCGSMIKSLANSAGSVAVRYDEHVKYMKEKVLPEVSSVQENLKSEVTLMEKLGDSIINELEAAENEVSTAWDSYYNKAVEFSGSPSNALKARRAGAQTGTVPNPDAAVDGCSDVWVDEMRYRMAVAFLSSCWEKCSSELSKLFLSMKDTECQRRSRLKELMIEATQRQERLWLGLPSVVNPILKELIEWPMERKLVEDDVQSSIRTRAQAIQRDEVEHKKADEVKPKASGLSGVDEKEGNFELSSPLVSDLMCKAKVVEKRSTGIMSSWKVTLAVVTSDSYLQLFELPPACKLQPGSAPEVAFQNLIPPVVVPTMEVVKGGFKLPSTKNWFDNLVPSESLALANCVVSYKDERANSTFEIVETCLASGASKVFTKTLNRKMQIRAVTPAEALDFIEALKGAK